jgi:hypothetical protein
MAIEKVDGNIKRPGPRPGTKYQKTIRKMAFKQLEQALLDESLSPELRAQAALRLTEANNNG